MLWLGDGGTGYSSDLSLAPLGGGGLLAHRHRCAELCPAQYSPLKWLSGSLPWGSSLLMRN